MVYLQTLYVYLAAWLRISSTGLLAFRQQLAIPFYFAFPLLHGNSLPESYLIAIIMI